MFSKGIKTTVIGIIAIIGLAYNGYTSGGFSVQDFLGLVFGVGFLFAKDADRSHTEKDGLPPNPDHEEH